MELLPVRENTIVILQPEGNTGSGALLTPDLINNDDEQTGQVDRRKPGSPERLDNTESYPENLGYRDTLFSITAQDYCGACCKPLLFLTICCD